MRCLYVLDVFLEGLVCGSGVMLHDKSSNFE